MVPLTARRETPVRRGPIGILMAVVIGIAGCGGEASTTPAPATPGAEPGGVAAPQYPTALPPEVSVTKTEVTIPMDDGVRLVASEFVPDVEGPVPTVVAFYPYGRNADIAGDHFSFPAEFGYAKLTVDVRGTGASEGTWSIYGEREIADYVEVIRWATTRPYNDGSVVLMGASSGAISALLAAQQPGVDGIVKAVYARTSHADAFRDLINSGGAANTAFVAAWAGGLIGVPSLYQPALSGQFTGPEVVLNATMDHLLGSTPGIAQGVISPLLGEYQGAVPVLDDIPDAAYDGPWYRTRSPIVNMDKITVPTMLMGANFDLFQRTQPLLYDALNLPPEHKKLISVGGWHFFGPNLLSSDDGTRLVYDDRGNVIPSDKVLRLAWFDRWGKGVANGIEALPTVEQAYHGRDTFTAQSTALAPRRAQSLFLSGDGTLREDAPVSGESTLVFQPFSGACSRNAVQNVGGRDNALTGDDLQTPCTADSRVNEADGVVFTTPPVTEETLIAGPANVQVWAHATRPETQIVAFVSVVGEDGTSTQIGYGSLSGSQRALEPTPCDTVVLDCTVYLDGQIIQPWHPYTLDAQADMEPGRIYRLDIEIVSMFAALQPGQRLRLTLKSGDFPKMVPTLSTMEDAVGGITTILFDDAHPSALIVGRVQD